MAQIKDQFWQQYWDRKRKRFQAAREKGEIITEVVGNRLHVSVPYNEAFVPRARELNGRWRTRSRVWSFPLVSQRLVLALLDELFPGKPRR